MSDPTGIPTYNPNRINFVKKWEADGLYHADIDETKPKFYALTILPYPIR